MKNIILLILIVISNSIIALGPTNVCGNSKSISEFSKLYVVEKTLQENKDVSWDIKVPIKYLDKYQLTVLYLVMYEKDNVVLRVPIHTTIKDEIAEGTFTSIMKADNTIQLFASYSENPGVVKFDGDFCGFMLN